MNILKHNDLNILIENIKNKYIKEYLYMQDITNDADDSYGDTDDESDNSYDYSNTEYDDMYYENNESDEFDEEEEYFDRVVEIKDMNGLFNLLSKTKALSSEDYHYFKRNGFRVFDFMVYGNTSKSYVFVYNLETKKSYCFNYDVKEMGDYIKYELQEYVEDYF
jgi:hypothetical protein